jgi:hypothetical protein
MNITKQQGVPAAAQHLHYSCSQEIFRAVKAERQAGMGSTIEPFICPPPARSIGKAHTPADHGIFLGRFDSQASRLVLITFIDSAKIWHKEIIAVGQQN